MSGHAVEEKLPAIKVLCANSSNLMVAETLPRLLCTEPFMAEKFKPGDIVRLKSGGPKMTVDSVAGHNVWATWFVDAKREHARFHEDSLEPVKDEK